MADPAEIEQELLQYLEKEPNLRRSDRIKYLMAIINKHYAQDRVEHSVNHYDFQLMLSNAKVQFTQVALPMEISRREVHSQEAVYVLMMEAFIGYLNSKNLLKRLVRFDHTRRK